MSKNEEKIALTIGKKTTKELCNWIGCCRTTYSTNKEKYLEELKEYCKYKKVYGGVEIEEVFEPYYITKNNKWQKKAIEEIDSLWNKNGLDTGLNVSCKFMEKHPKMNYAESTVQKLILNARNEQYGKPFRAEGKLGYCEYILCTRDKTTQQLRFLTPEEEKVKQKYLQKYFKNSDEKMLIVRDMLNSGELTNEEAFEYLEDITYPNGTNGWYGFFAEMRAAGIPLTRGTLVTRNAVSYLEEIPNNE